MIVDEPHQLVIYVEERQIIATNPMIDNYLLKALVAFDKYGTFAKTADHLGVTQPAVTRALQKIEQALDAHIFDRGPNKISLTETGKFAVQEAQKLLWTNKAYIIKVQNFDQTQAQIRIASNAPGPLIILRSLHLNNIKIVNEPVMHDYERILIDNQVTCLLINQPIYTSDIDSVYLGIESMVANLAGNSSLADKNKVAFKDLHGQTILSPSNLGFGNRSVNTVFLVLISCIKNKPMNIVSY